MDSGFFTVKFDSVLLKDVVVEADCIIPPLREDDLPSSSDSDDSGDEDEDDVVFAKGVYGYELLYLSIKARTSLRNLFKSW